VETMLNRGKCLEHVFCLMTQGEGYECSRGTLYLGSRQLILLLVRVDARERQRLKKAIEHQRPGNWNPGVYALLYQN
jgi:hypothetical protein